jgi:hypothetical protein
MYSSNIPRSQANDTCEIKVAQGANCAPMYRVSSPSVYRGNETGANYGMFLFVILIFLGIL